MRRRGPFDRQLTLDDRIARVCAADLARLDLAELELLASLHVPCVSCRGEGCPACEDTGLVRAPGVVDGGAA